MKQAQEGWGNHNPGHDAAMPSGSVAPGSLSPAEKPNPWAPSGAGRTAPGRPPAPRLLEAAQLFGAGHTFNSQLVCRFLERDLVLTREL